VERFDLLARSHSTRQLEAVENTFALSNTTATSRLRASSLFSGTTIPASLSRGATQAGWGGGSSGSGTLGSSKNVTRSC
jgi:hypothetical protein